MTSSGAVRFVDQDIRVGEDSQRWRIDDHVIEKPAGLLQHSGVGRAREQFGNIVALPAARQKVEPGRLQANDGVFQLRSPASTSDKPTGKSIPR